MKIKRAKKVSKILNYFKQNFGFRSPYLLLLDGTFCAGCLVAKVNIKDQLPKYLGEARLLTTSCCITELEKLGPPVYGAMMVAKSFPIFKCGHKQAQPANNCIMSLLGEKNSQHFIVASQDNELRSKIRKIPGVPLLLLHGNCPTLEKPSGMTVELIEKTSDEKTLLSSHEARTIKELKKQVFGEEEPKKKKKRRGPKGPNPLSVKKKKSKTNDSLHGVKNKLESEGKKKKRRNKNKVLAQSA
eukprot:GFUD01005465.1.p1 GENE.GFUD01005465.1~~GFUD01005465.1.p1  ORF type:complete len:243 (+),score=62.33 GFUD01005465.1:50-778(+)